MSKALFALDAWNTVTFVAEETRDPVKTLPKALFMGTLGVTILYALANVAYLHVLPVEAAAAVPDQRIAAEVARIILGPIGVSLIAAAILISSFGCDNGLVLAGPRLYFAMARDGLFLKGAANIDPERGTPVRSLWYQALWTILLVLDGKSRCARVAAVQRPSDVHIVRVAAVQRPDRRRSVRPSIPAAEPRSVPIESRRIQSSPLCTSRSRCSSWCSSPSAIPETRVWERW